MKKVYVLAAAALLCVSANAANSAKRSEVKAPAKVQVQMEKALTNVVVAQEANHSIHRTAPKKVQPTLGEAFYKRPAGSMYGGLTSNSYLYFNPYVTVKPYAKTTFEANPLDSYNWRVQMYNAQIKGREWLTANSQSINVEYGWETDSVPTITDGVTEYHVYGKNSDETLGWSSIAGIPDMTEWSYDEAAGFALLSPKYFGKRDSDYASSRYSGAKDAEGGTSGMWFGKNYSGWNAMGLYVEAPQNPYVLRKVFVDYSALELAADADLFVEVYKVASRVADSDSLNMDIERGDLIASGFATLVKGEAPEEGILEIPFYEEVDGLTFEVTPTIEEEILIVISGYDSDNIINFSMAIASDEWDEGYGQHGYMIRTQGGEYTHVIGLDHFFTSSLGCTAPTVFLDVFNPFMVYNYNTETGVRSFDKDGACTSTFAPNGMLPEQVSIYSFTSSEEMTFTLEDGSELPEWLTIDAVDVIEEDEFSGEVVLTVSCAANTGEAREVNVKISIPGANLILKVEQEGGEPAPQVPGDVDANGSVDLNDMNILINIMLGKADGAAYPAADIDGNGAIELVDMNSIINILLGK